MGRTVVQIFSFCRSLALAGMCGWEGGEGGGESLLCMSLSLSLWMSIWRVC